MLITCPECEEIVSNQAEYCPHCGCPNKYLIEVEPFDSYIIGKKVNHSTFGEGVVVAYENGNIEIEFNDNDIKEFTLENFLQFNISETTITKLLMNEVKICEMNARKEREILYWIKHNEVETEESKYGMPDAWEPTDYNESGYSESDYYESDEDYMDSISDSYAYYYGDDEIL